VRGEGEKRNEQRDESVHGREEVGCVESGCGWWEQAGAALIVWCRVSRSDPTRVKN
jgi:hypothetical protein